MLYANTLFPFSDVSCRLVDIFSVSDTEPRVRDEALKGLSPSTFRESVLEGAKLDQGTEYPDLLLLLQATSDRVIKTDSKTNSNEITEINPSCCAALTAFLKSTFDASAEKQKISHSEFFSKFADENPEQLRFYISLLESSLKAHTAKTTMHFRATSTLLDFFSYHPQTMSNHFKEKLDFLTNLLYVGSYDSRKNLAICIGLMSPFLSETTLQALLSTTANYISDNTSGLDKQVKTNLFFFFWRSQAIIFHQLELMIFLNYFRILIAGFCSLFWIYSFKTLKTFKKTISNIWRYLQKRNFFSLSTAKLLYKRSPICCRRRSWKLCKVSQVRAARRR